MSYKYEESIKFLIAQSRGHVKEINEVYVKAKAFDEIEQVIYENTGLGEGDEDLVNYENSLDEIEIITNDVESEAE